VDAADPAAVAAVFAEMEAKLSQALEGRSELEWVRTADLRYGGQSWEVEVGLSAGPVDARVLAALRARFEDEHERLYGVKDRAGSPVEIRALRLAALGEAVATRGYHLEDANGAGSGGGGSSRRIHIGGESVDAPVRRRSSLGTGPEAGPLLVDEYDTTVVVPPGWSARRDGATATLVLERSADGD
jgi:N-methylhydantoinase A